MAIYAKHGSRGSLVRQLSTALIWLGYLTGKPRDYFTAGMAGALKTFQGQPERRKLGIHATGELDDKTLDAVNGAIDWRRKHPTPKQRGKPVPHHLTKPRPPAPLPYVFPVQGAIEEMRTDRGQDMQGRAHARVYAIGDAKITATAPESAISSLGQVVMELAKPWHWAGRIWRWPYFFHVERGMVRVHTGQRVRKGAVLATLSEHPPGYPDHPGWIEYGFALAPDGSIDENVGPDHFAESGAAMHALLHAIDPHKIGPKPIRA